MYPECEFCTKYSMKCNKDVCPFWDSCKERVGGNRHKNCPCINCEK